MSKHGELVPGDAPVVGEADAIVQHRAGQLPWGHIMVLLDRLDTREERDWYAARATAEGWKRSVLEHFIKVGLRSQLGTAPTNFATTLASPDSELAQQLMKDPYVFESSFLGQLSAYVGVVEDRLCDRSKHAPTIGVLLCTGKNEAIVRYTLANMTAALGVADYEGLPADVRAALPSAGELRAVIAEEQAAIEARSAVSPTLDGSEAS
jgi:predicted nuclease of restriction endonuclease-like (RecB) superfamily